MQLYLILFLYTTQLLDSLRLWIVIDQLHNFIIEELVNDKLINLLYKELSLEIRHNALTGEPENLLSAKNGDEDFNLNIRVLRLFSLKEHMSFS